MLAWVIDHPMQAVFRLPDKYYISQWMCNTGHSVKYTGYIIPNNLRAASPYAHVMHGYVRISSPRSCCWLITLVT